MARAGRPTAPRSPSGCADNSVRVIDAKTGEQVLFGGSHSDWVLDTVFSVKGSHLITVGRDRTAKLIEVDTQRFIDNITSITPGALKGGIQAVTRHPQRDEIVVGGSDGTPKIYRVFRQSNRAIGDDANLIRQFPAMPGRVNAVAVSPDGKRIAAASSSDGTGQVDVLNYDFDTTLPDNIKAIESKVVSQRTPEEKADARGVPRQNTKVIAQAKVAAGGDLRRLVPARRQGRRGRRGRRQRPPDRRRDRQGRRPVRPRPARRVHLRRARPPTPAVARRRQPPAATATAETETLPKGAVLAALEVEPKEIAAGRRSSTSRSWSSPRVLDSGERIDVTRMVEVEALGRHRRGLADRARPGARRRPGDAVARRWAAAPATSR